MSLTLRRTKLNGSPAPLTNDELDDNFVHLENGILSLGEIVEDLNNKNTANTEELVDANLDISNLVLRVNGLDNKTSLLASKDLFLDADITNINNNINTLRSDVYTNLISINKLLIRPFLSDETIIVEKSTHIPSEITIKASNLLVHTSKSQTITNKTISGSSNTFVNIPATTLSGKVPITNGGTNADNASTARTNLGLAIGVDVQSYNASTVISTNSNTFTNNNYFNHNGFFLSNLSQSNLKSVSFRLSNSAGTSNHVLTIPEKSGTLATLDDIVINGVLHYEDIGVRVLAHDSQVAYKNRNNYFDNNAIQTFSNNNFVLRDGIRVNTTAKFVMSPVAENATISMGVPPESGILATREYVENRFGAPVISNFSTPGYYVMPGGLIIQWGTKVINQTQHSPNLDGQIYTSHLHSRTYGEIIFPITFPNACFVVTATGRDTTTAYIDGCETAIGIIKKQNEKFNFLVNRITGHTANGAETTMNVDFIAIGW